MFDFSFSGSYPKKTMKTSFLRSSSIPEWMDLGIIAEVESLRGDIPKRSYSSEIKK